MATLDAVLKQASLVEQHMDHCDTGEYVGSCKYGDEDCPALVVGRARDRDWPEQLCSDGPKPLDPDNRFADLEAQVELLTSQVQTLANQLARFAERQIEMRGDLLRAGAFEKKSSIIMPGDRN